MQIQVNTDSHIDGSAEHKRDVEQVLQGALQRFEARVTRVEVHLTDESSSQKSGDADKRCLIEARLAGLQPIAVSANGSSPRQALDAAVAKLVKTLGRTLGRLDEPKGRTSYAGDGTV